MVNITETKFGTLVSPNKIASGSASSIKKNGAFYSFKLMFKKLAVNNIINE